jgi:MFS family permease
MSNKRAFWSKATPVLLLGVFLMFFYSGLQNDHLNVLITHYESSPIGSQIQGEAPDAKMDRVKAEMSEKISSIEPKLSEDISAAVNDLNEKFKSSGKELSGEEYENQLAETKSQTAIRSYRESVSGLTDNVGWTNKAITNPVTMAGIFVIILTFLIGTMLITYGVVRVVVPSLIILALFTIGLGFTRTDAGTYSICLFMVRLMVVPLMMGAFMLCTNWFVNLRGRALGIITVGCPLFTATGLPGLKLSVGHFGITWSYAIVGIIVLVLALLVGLFVKSKPEECGLYPDGSDTEIETSTGETKSIPFGELASNSGFWLLIVSFGILQFVIVCVMAFYMPRLEEVGTSQATYLFWIMIAAILGTPISLVLGWIDDKFGTVIASLVLCVLFIVALYALLIMKANQIPLIVIAAFGLAGMMGGTPNLHPSITTYVFGRDNYQAANRWIMSIQAFMMAFSYLFMSIIRDETGNLDLSYKIMMGLVVLAMICLVIVGRKPDYDRSKSREAVA